MSTSRSGSFRAVAITAIASFVLGAAAVGYFGWQGELFAARTAAGESAAPTAAAQPPRAAAPNAGARSLVEPTPTARSAARGERTAQGLQRVAQQQGGIEQRLAAAEQRLTRLDLQAQAASGNAARAEGLLIAFATRRALERGAELGYLADQLRLRFGDALPNAVRTVIAQSRDPVTKGELAARLDAMGDALKVDDSGPSLAQLRRELSSLFTIRRENTPTARPEKRFERAQRFFDSGRYQAAIEEVQKMPGAPHAASWIRDVRRYAAAQRALDLIETSAVLEPRALRDGSGKPIGQPSPAATPAIDGETAAATPSG